MIEMNDGENFTWGGKIIWMDLSVSGRVYLFLKTNECRVSDSVFVSLCVSVPNFAFDSLCIANTSNSSLYYYVHLW